MWGTVAIMWFVAVVAGQAEVMPTGVIGNPQRTTPPEEVSRPQFVQTLYKATDYSVIKNTLVPLWPSYSVEFDATHTYTVNNQTISISTAELSTVLNTTADFYTDLVATNTLEVAPTTYQTMEFQHQTVLYTDRNNESHTEVQDNDLPFV